MPHARFIDGAREFFQGGYGATVQIEPVKIHRCVLRKKMKIIIEDDEVVFLDLGVRRVGVFEVNRAIC